MDDDDDDFLGVDVDTIVQKHQVTHGCFFNVPQQVLHARSLDCSQLREGKNETLRFA